VSDGVVSRPFLPREYFCVVSDQAGECVDWSGGYAQVRRKKRGPAVHRPSTVNQEAAGSSPARGANYYNDFRSAPSMVTGSCVA